MSEQSINVQCHGMLEQVCGGFQRRVAVAPGPVIVSDVLERLSAEVPALRAHLAHTACAVGDRIVERDARLDADETLVLIPPVSGG